MQFNGNTDQQDCVSEILKITKATVGKYPLKDIARRFNFALDRFFTLAFQADGRWNFDDLNQTTAPIESINLAIGVEKYALDTFVSEIINVLRVEMLNSAGTGITLQRLDRNSIAWQSLPQYNFVAGIPNSYDLLGKFIYLYPKPNYNSTNGLTLYFERNKVAFASTDTTKVPGIPSIFHMYLCRLSAQPYLDENTMGNSAKNQQLILQDEAAIMEHFSHREKSIPTKLMPRVRSAR